MEQNFIIANRTDVGATREVNEDCMVTFDSPNGRVIAVCDGMGGQAAGDVASALACDIIRDILENNTFSTPTEAITRAILAANQGILHRAASNPELEGMGSTCVMVIIKDGLAYYGWVGDSRIYYYSNGNLRQISRDQSYVQQLVDAGQISAAEAENHPQKNEITNALGLQNMTPPELCTAPLTPEPGSMMLLCSDGLSGMVDPSSIEQVLANRDMSLQDKADRLVVLANAAGGIDNITVQLVEFGTPGVAAAPVAAPVQMSQKGGNKVMWIGGIALIVVIIAIVVFFTMGGKKEPQNATAKENVNVEKVEKVEKKEPKADKPEPAPAPAKEQNVTKVSRKQVKKDRVSSMKGVTGKKDEDKGNDDNKKEPLPGLIPKSGDKQTPGSYKEEK